MSSDRWHRIEHLFDEAVEKAPAERGAFLEEACAGDDELRREVTALLDAADDTHGALDDLARRAGVGPRSDPSLTLEEHSFTSAGSYRIVRELGRGGMGRVYLAERAGTQFVQEVALKVVKRGMDSDLVLQRFLRERQILARLEHPNIARFFDGGLTDSGQPYFAMEYVNGKSLTDYCDSNGLGVEDRLELFLEVCEALQYAHGCLVVHRDLKPSNILVTESSDSKPSGARVKLLDFGIAKLLGVGDEESGETLTETGMPVMTPEYAAPEQVRGAPVTTATDVYALGVILYELLSGHRPYRFDVKTPAEIARVVQNETPARPSTALVSQARGAQVDRLRRRLEGDLDTICLMALRKEPERRYPSVWALAEDIKRHLAGLPVVARKDSASYRVQKFVRRNRVVVAAVAIVMISLAVGLGLALWHAGNATEQRDLARQETAKAERALDFLVRVFEVADPRETGGEILTAPEILAQGSELIKLELAGQPEMQAMLDNAVGRAYQGMGRLEEARTFFERSVELWRAEEGADSPDVAAGTARLGNLSRIEGDYETAESLLRQALDAQLRIHGEEHLRVATTLDLLGILMVETQRRDEGVELHEKALATRRKLLGPNHRDVAVSLNNLAGAITSMDRLDEAIALYREAIVIWRKAVGPKHPDVAVAMNNLARLLRTQGDLDAAEPLYREALGIWRGHYGDDHSTVAAVLGNLAALLRAQGDLEAAEPVYREALDIGRRTLGDTHPSVGIRINNLGKLLHDKGDLEGAEASFREALAIWRAAHGEGHARIVIGLTNLAAVLTDKKDAEAAEARYREALDIAGRALPAGHPRIATVLQGLGGLALDRDDGERAEPLLRKAREFLLESYGDADARTAEAGRLHALALAGLARNEEAEALLLECCRVFDAEYGEADARSQQAREDLARLYAKWQRPSESGQ